MDNPIVIRPYEPFNWKDHVTQKPRTYRPIHNEDGTITLTPEEGYVYQQGTPMNAERLNHMEQGIANNDARLPVADIATIDLSGITSALYPRLTLLYGGYGYGIGGYGETPAGGSGAVTVDAIFTYDEGTVHVIVPKQYAAYTHVEQTGERTFSLSTGSEDDAQALTLIVDDSTASSESSGGSGTGINDSLASTYTTYSSEKIESLVDRYLGLNPIAATNEDTTAHWSALGTGYARFTKAVLDKQPSPYGILLNWARDGIVWQQFNSSPNGPTYNRSGNADGWSTGGWRRVYDTSNPPPSSGSYTLPVATSDTLGGVMPAEKTDDMTQAVGVDAEGALWTKPGAGGEGGGETLVAEPTLLATGTIPAETGAGTHIITGLTLADLRTWKMFCIRIASANVKQTNLYFSIEKSDGSLNSFIHSTGQTGWAVIVSWADTARTALVMNGGVYDKAGLSVGNIGKNAPTGGFYNANSEGSTWVGHRVAVLDSSPDTADAVFHSLSAFTADFAWDIWGLIK